MAWRSRSLTTPRPRSAPRRSQPGSDPGPWRGQGPSCHKVRPATGCPASPARLPRFILAAELIRPDGRCLAARSALPFERTTHRPEGTPRCFASNSPGRRRGLADHRAAARADRRLRLAAATQRRPRADRRDQRPARPLVHLLAVPPAQHYHARARRARPDAPARPHRPPGRPSPAVPPSSASSSGSATRPPSLMVWQMGSRGASLGRWPRWPPLQRRARRGADLHDRRTGDLGRDAGAVGRALARTRRTRLDRDRRRGSHVVNIAGLSANSVPITIASFALLLAAFGRIAVIVLSASPAVTSIPASKDAPAGPPIYADNSGRGS